MGKLTNPLAAVLFLVIYLSISLYFISKSLNFKGNMIVPRTVQIAGFSNLLLSKRELHVGARVNLSELSENITSKLKKILEIDRTRLGPLSLDRAVGRIERIQGDKVMDGKSFNLLREDGSGLEKDPGICKSLVSGIDRVRWKAVKKIKSKQKKFGLRVYTDKNITNVFNNCEKISSFIKSSTPNISRTEKPIAFSILLNRPADQTFQLLRAIYNPSNVYCLHVHLDATKRYFNFIKKLAGCVENFYISDARYRISYATNERIKAHLSCHKILLNTTTSWRYIISIPGSVFPLRNNTFLAEYLENRDYLNSIAYSDRSHKSFLRRTTFVHKISERPDGYKFFTRTKQLKDPPPYNMTLFRSDISFIATRSFAEFVVTSNVSRALLEWAKDTRSPDEFFWATLDRLPGTPGGTPYRKEAIDLDYVVPGAEDVLTSDENDLVVRLWKGQKTPKCGGKYSANLCVFNYKDLRWLLGQDSLFADAFDMKVDNVVIGCLHRNLKEPLVEDYHPNNVNDYT